MYCTVLISVELRWVEYITRGCEYITWPHGKYPHNKKPFISLIKKMVIKKCQTLPGEGVMCDESVCIYDYIVSILLDILRGQC